MKKLRWTFGVLAAVCAALFAVLLFSVHRQIEAERSAPHRAVAERAFDEMERSLTEILERDDERSRYGTRSTSEAAAYGYFELYPEGRQSFASRYSADLVARSVIDAPEASDASDQAPGTTIALRGAIGEVPAYRAIAAFNRGADLRELHVDDYHFGAYEARASADHVVVFRSLSRRISGGRSEWRSFHTGHLEGIVFQRTALRDWLARQTFGVASVDGFDLVTVGADPRPSTEPYVFRHRFAAPFDDLAAVLTVTPIASASSATTVYVLAALFALAVLGGLFAAYRMTATRVRFAERQDQFVSAVTHELRTPLTTLRMYSEMLRDGIVPPESQREYYDAMVSESERLGRLVDNVLTKAKMGRREHARSEPADLAPLIAHAVSVLLPHARAKGFELTTSIDEALPRVIAERDAITQVVVNLVDNAMVHSGPSAEQRVIELRCERRAGRVVLSVRDHGRGVPDELLEDIFEPFVSGAPSARGVGLGLALVRSLVSRMGGVVFAENAAGGGLRVTALLSAA